MKSKASFFSLSKPLMVENLRRFWAIPALSFLVYFLSGVFPILMSYSKINNLAYYIEMSLNNQQPFFIFANLLFPVLTAVIIFRYLQGISSVSVMHSMPFTRAKLFHTGFLSGLILIIAPVLANGLILLAISKPAFKEYGTQNGMMTNSVNIFSRADILNWIWVSVLVIIVVYAISVFAGIVTGNTLMHFATALFFNFIIPGLYAVFIAYFSHYLYGFNSNGNWIDICMKISPYLYSVKSGNDFGTLITVYYIIIVLVLYGLSGFLYQKRKLEHATDSLAFGFMEPVICYLITFLGMTLLGFYFEVMGEDKSEFYLYAGLIAGTIIFFIIGQMIVKKTPRIFNRSSLKSVGIYALIAVVFIACIALDITGFEKRVPDPAKVDEFTFGEDFMRNYDVYNYGNGYHPSNENDQPFVLKDPKNIEAITALHHSVIERENQFKNLQNRLTSTLQLTYNPKSSFPLNRRYTIDYNFIKNNQDLKTIFESKEFKNYFSLKNLKYEKLNSINFSPEKPLSEVVEIRNPKDIEEFMTCLEKDFQNQSYEDMISLKHSYAIANINFSYKDKNSAAPEQLLENTINYKITTNYTNSINWLREHQLAEKLELKLSDVDYIEIVHYIQQETDGSSSSISSYDTGMIAQTDLKTLKITDPAKIKALLESYDSQTTNYKDYYYGIVYMKGNGQFSEEYLEKNYAEEAYAKEMGPGYDKETSLVNGNPTMQIYLNDEAIPGYVLEYFAQ